MKKALFYLALGGLLLSLAAHLVSLAGINLQGAASFLILLLFAILFIVWLPTVIIIAQRQKRANPNFGTRMNTVAMLKIWFDGAPRWLIAIAVVAFIYAGINFMLFTSTMSESQQKEIGIGGLRAMTGHLMAFYAVAAAALCAASKRGDEK